MKYTITSDRWAQDPVEATFEDLQEQAKYFTLDRRALDDETQRSPVTVECAIRNGQDVVIDDTGEIIAVAVV